MWDDPLAMNVRKKESVMTTNNPREHKVYGTQGLQDGKNMPGLLRAIRKEFPRVGVDASGRTRIFFENAAGSLVLQRAVEAESKARRDFFPNVGEASWESRMNENTILEGRKAVSDFLNASSEDCIVSGESATSLLFQISYALSKELPQDGNVVTTEYEHYANISPWTELERRGIVKEVRFATFNADDGMLDMQHFASLLDRKTQVVAVTGVSNGLGSKTPLNEVFRFAQEIGAYTILDAVHMAPHVPIDVSRLECDFAVFSAYKLFSRRGSFMYGRRDLLERTKPYKVEPSPNHPPAKWEMGTRDQALFASIAAVIDYLSWLGQEVQNQVSDRVFEYSGRRRLLKAALTWIEEYERTLSEAMLYGTKGHPGMLGMKGVQVYGLKDESRIHLRTPTFSFDIAGVELKKVAEHMWIKHGVVVIADDFYSRALRTYGKPLAIRASLVHCNTIQEVETFLAGLAETVRHFGAG